MFCTIKAGFNSFFQKWLFSFKIPRVERSSVLYKISQSLSELTGVSVSSIWAEILKMPLLSAGKTNFLRFRVIPNATVSLVRFVKYLGIFCEGGGGIPNCFFLSFLLFWFPFLLFVAASLRALESYFSSSESEATSSDK